MAKYRITGPDGGTYEVNAPDSASEAEVMAYAQQNYKAPAAPQKKEKKEGGILQDAGNLAAGAIRGAGSIGATLLYPVDKITDMVKGDRETTLSDLILKQELGDKFKPKLSRNEERRQAMDDALQSMGAQPDSWMYKGGKLAGEIAGTAGAGGVLANSVRAVAPGATGLANALATGGFKAGTTPGVANALTRIAGGAGTGGASAGLVNPEDAGMGALVGGALPGVAQAVGGAARAVGRGMRGAPVAPEVAALAKRAEELGIKIPADRLTDSKPMNALASALNYVPFSGRAATEDAMVSQLNNRLSKTFGQSGSNVTAALRKADDALGGQFDNFLRSNTVNLDKAFLDDLADAANMASKELGTDGARIIGNQVDEILAKAADGVIDGQAAYNIKKTLDKIGKRNSPEAAYALDLKGKLMDALNRSVGDEKAKAFKGLRHQYGNMLALQKLAANGAEGEISVARLANLKNIRNPEMQELADIAAQFVKPREGQHGAAQRAFAGAAGLTLGGIPGLAAGAGAGRGLNMLLNSQVARDGVLGQPSLRVPNKLLEAIQQGGYRAAPVVSAQ